MRKSALVFLGLLGHVSSFVHSPCTLQPAVSAGSSSFLHSRSGNECGLSIGSSLTGKGKDGSFATAGWMTMNRMGNSASPANALRQPKLLPPATQLPSLPATRPSANVIPPHSTCLLRVFGRTLIMMPVFDIFSSKGASAFICGRRWREREGEDECWEDDERPVQIHTPSHHPRDHPGLLRLRHARVSHNNPDNALCGMASDPGQPSTAPSFTLLVNNPRSYMLTHTICASRADYLRAGLTTDGDDRAVGAALRQRLH
eukprot:2113086-Rhodomonas_salina.1